ncbi:hypothetical protein J7F03_25915 [Streptomyces sp. ISL-43]|uniref:hypothetical protein n=1 Tax=Streptomyces sp. ISL-43 TaxID=2819183 RepID=UPI001BE98911|nr:hypothetical protein [Streptomyces sp. ISL-43]MBT2450450.1 hypothetical protein [Streptomyces sp. ISL-43]
MPESGRALLVRTPCPHCVHHAWQRIDGGRLRWEAEWECDRCEFGGPPDACNLDYGWGRAPDHVRAAIVAAEGTVLLRVDAPGGAALKVFRDTLGMTIPQALTAARSGYPATPTEARHLTALLHESGFSARTEQGQGSGLHGVGESTAPPTARRGRRVP